MHVRLEPYKTRKIYDPQHRNPFNRIAEFNYNFISDKLSITARKCLSIAQSDIIDVDDTVLLELIKSACLKSVKKQNRTETRKKNMRLLVCVDHETFNMRYQDVKHERIKKTRDLIILVIVDGFSKRRRQEVMGKSFYDFHLQMGKQLETSRKRSNRAYQVPSNYFSCSK